MLSQSSSLSKALILTIASLCIFFQLAVAVPAAEVEKRTVFTPLVTYPHTGTVWYKGQTHNVTVKHYRQIRRQDPAQERRHYAPVILQSNFDVLLGRIEVVVPWVLSDTDYSLVFFGDSGDLSEQFTIME